MTVKLIGKWSVASATWRADHWPAIQQRTRNPTDIAPPRRLCPNQPVTLTRATYAVAVATPAPTPSPIPPPPPTVPFTTAIVAVAPAPPSCVLRFSSNPSERLLELTGFNFSTTNHNLQFRKAATGEQSIQYPQLTGTFVSLNCAAWGCNT